MKKSLLALAALTAFAGAASAQSSVTAFGIVDLAGTYVDGATSKYLLASGGMSTSRLGFRGIEDLGGGLKAGFWLEGQLDADDGNAAGFNWQRRSTVSLISNVGEMRMGRDNTPMYTNWVNFDPFGATGLGSALNLGLEASAFNYNATTKTYDYTYSTLKRVSNSVSYFLPSMGGLYGQAMVAAGEGTPGNKTVAGRLGYAAGPFDVVGAYGITEFSDSADMKNWDIAGSFDAGFAKFTAMYSELDADNNLFKQTNWFVGATVPFGAWSFKGTYGKASRDATSLTFGDTKKPVAFGDADQIAVGVVYDLSKRTALYGTYSTISNTGTAFRVFDGTNAPALKADHDSKGYALGIRHSF